MSASLVALHGWTPNYEKDIRCFAVDFCEGRDGVVE
jgi:hypothetical protein